MKLLPSTLKHSLWSLFKLITLEFTLTILIAERIERCTAEEVFKDKRRNKFRLKYSFLMFNIQTA